jgi:two-component system OmpR family sensor kinase
LSPSEKKSIFNILLVYLSSTILLVLSISFIYYNYKKTIITEQLKEEVKNYPEKVIQVLRKNHNMNIETIEYPRYKNFNSAIYDIDHNLIFSTMYNNNIDLSKSFYQKKNFSYLIYKNSPYYLGAAFIVIEVKNKNIIDQLINEIFIILSITIIFIVFTSIFLIKLLLKPIRNNLKILDRFIKDTTHELNTPISAILGNIETFDIESLNEKNAKKLNRIKIGVFTISNIYQDLVYLVLNDKTISQNENINVSDIVKDRVEYFQILSQSKKIKIKIDVQNNLYCIADKLKISRLIDNLLSNAIKYSKIGTNIDIKIKDNQLIVKDEGYGMREEDIAIIFERYSRFDNSNQGGFGIGYNIIYSIIKEYDIKIDIQSKLQKGTTVTLTW